MRKFDSHQEKIQYIREYRSRIRRLNFMRLFCAVVSVLLLLYVTQTHYQKTVFAFSVIFALLSSLISAYNSSQYICPVCGEGLGYWARKHDKIPDECPNCGENLNV